MKFLIDNQLPAALARHLQGHGFEASHVAEFGMERSTDRVIWQYAVNNGFVIVSQDEDFLHLSGAAPSGPPLVWVRLGNCRKPALLAAFDRILPQLMRHLFTYGPVPFDQADRVALGETNYEQVPEDWSIRPLNECAKVQTGVAKGRRIDNGEAVEVPYLRVANVQDGYLDLAEIKNITIRRSEMNRYSLQEGDVVLTEGGDFDKLDRGFIWNGEVPSCAHQNHIFAVRSNQAILVPEFMAYLTQSAYGKSYFLSVAHKTTNLACINTTKLKALPVLLPSLAEQHEIVAALQGIDKKIEVEMRKSRALDALFQTLLHHLMTGTVRVHDVAAFAPGEGPTLT